MPDLPCMPEPEVGADLPERDELIEFHWTGEPATQALNGLEPALLASLPRPAAEDRTEDHPYAPLDLYAAAVRNRRKAIEVSFETELSSLVSRVSDLLSNDAGRAEKSRSASTLDRELGLAGVMVDAERLSHLAAGRRGATGLSVERRARLKQALGTLRNYLSERDGTPRIVVLDSGLWPRDQIWPDVHFADAERGLEEAVEFFEQSAERMAEVFRAARVARLELAEAYEPARHDAALARFNWRSVTAEELALFPQIVAVRRVESADAKTMAGLSELLCSGRPVHVLLLDQPLRRQARAAGRTQLEIGYLAVAHRDAFVLQSTLARPAHLLSGLDRMVGSGRAAMAMIAVPSSDDRSAHELQLLAAHEGLATPCFCYDPKAGESWAACFEYEDEAPEEQPWPVHELTYRDEHGAERARSEAFTFAHAAALEPEFRGHFRIAAPESWDDAQIEIAEYLALEKEDRRGKLPFVWVVVDGRLSRAVVTLDLASACRDRLETRRLFRELDSLGGIAPHPQKAAEIETPVAQPSAVPADDLERIRQEAGAQAIQRLVNVLLDLGDTPGALELPVTPATAVEPAAVTSAPIEQAYIDSALCTTCDDCTKLNSRMFRYNDDKQAYVADVSAGTFAELVKAAEKCPARCIHPGAPRNGDSSVTNALKTRAARFN